MVDVPVRDHELGDVCGREAEQRELCLRPVLGTEPHEAAEACRGRPATGGVRVLVVRARKARVDEDDVGLEPIA